MIFHASKILTHPLFFDLQLQNSVQYVLMFVIYPQAAKIQHRDCAHLILILCMENSLHWSNKYTCTKNKNKNKLPYMHSGHKLHHFLTSL